MFNEFYLNILKYNILLIKSYFLIIFLFLLNFSNAIIILKTSSAFFKESKLN